MWKVVYICLAVKALVVVSFVNSNMKNLDQTDDTTYRLPNDTAPTNYSINLIFGDFDRDDMRFTGNVYVIIKVLESTNTIILHSSVLINSTSLTKSANGETAIAHTYDIDAEREFLIIRTTEEKLERDALVWLRIDYSGVISTTSDAGIFRGSYTKNDGSMSYYVATRTKPNYARSIFPSYDEPRFKASFQIKLTHSERYSAISNMRETFYIDQKYNKGRKMTSFEATPYIPTYLIAFVISEFDVIERKASNNVSLRIFTIPQQTQNAAFGFEITERAIEIFENEFSFEIPFSFDKLDQVALPLFNQCTNSVNYGISIYQQNCLLFDNSVNTVHEKELAALAIINSVCHQYLGNRLITSWWTTQWLSDGLCRFYEYYMVERINPTIAMQGLFTIEIVENALRSDTSSSNLSHSLMHYEQSPDGVRNVLVDGIAYNKSASIFRMFFHSLGETTFTEGLKIYLSESTSNPSSVTVQRNIYDAWQRAASMSNSEDDTWQNYKVEELFGNWEQTKGYPILYVERSYNDRRVRFTQMSSRKDEDTLWYVPITYISRYHSNNDDLRPNLWLPKVKQLEILIDDLRSDSYLLINVDRMGYYRVQYDEANWMLISKELSRTDSSSPSNISPISRAMLMNDAAIFLANNMLKARMFLELMKHLEHDVEYLPWLVATNNLQYIRWMVVGGSKKLSDDFKRFLQKLLSKVFITYGVEEQSDEPNYHKHMRNIAIAWSCEVHLQSCLDVTREKLWKYILNEESGSMSVDQEWNVFCSGLIMATEHEFDFIWKLFRRTANMNRRKFYLSAMGCIEDEGILMKFILMIIDSEDVEADDEWKTVLRATYSNNPVGLRVTLQFLRSHYDAFIGLLQKLNVMSAMNEILQDIAAKVSDEKLSSILYDLLDIYNIDSNAQKQIRSIVSGNLLWLNTHSTDIQSFLDDFHSSSSTKSLSSFTLPYLVIIFGFCSLNWIM